MNYEEYKEFYYPKDGEYYEEDLWEVPEADILFEYFLTF